MQILGKWRCYDMQGDGQENGLRRQECDDELGSKLKRACGIRWSTGKGVIGISNLVFFYLAKLLQDFASCRRKKMVLVEIFQSMYLYTCVELRKGLSSLCFCVTMLEEVWTLARIQDD